MGRVPIIGADGAGGPVDSRRTQGLPGAFHPEQLDPDPDTTALGPLGLPWQIQESDPLTAA
ncbi:MAG: hypothetical protein H7A45_13190 [Verrucomicrobiales bacterium]|nr:hypothetical protein [Verrucomicrobiales bacterium]